MAHNARGKAKSQAKSRAKSPAAPQVTPQAKGGKRYTFGVMCPRMAGVGTVAATDDADATRQVRNAYPDALTITVALAL